MSYMVYMVRCSDGSLYTGYTSDIARRIAVHNSGRASKYTRSRLPVVLVYTEEATDLGTALRREGAIKKLSRKDKLALCHTSTKRSRHS